MLQQQTKADRRFVRCGLLSFLGHRICLARCPGVTGQRLFDPFLFRIFLFQNLYFDYIKYLALHSLHCEKEKVPRQQRLPGTDGYEKKSRNLSHFCGSFCVSKDGMGLVFQNARWYNITIYTVSKDIYFRFYMVKI
ncbi:hypothetical protein EIO64_17655 [Dysosmobacter welbionis]|uniref:Uncharacterized protein n=1 Tax=Dysosmobacter welbionis TaxID=2093857 RepID=A0A4D7ANF3_9FIRM|nr:hypothetical protein [Dysosmobacter welbionis]QCI60809.1 hypothetical protein EIO64_17655 [Dysosmobacter welbionis]